MFFTYGLEQINKLPAAMMESNTLDTFKHRLQTHLTFLTNCNSPSMPARRLTAPWIRFFVRLLCALQISMVYVMLKAWQLLYMGHNFMNMTDVRLMFVAQATAVVYIVTKTVSLLLRTKTVDHSVTD